MPSTIPLTSTPESSQIAGWGYDPTTKRLAVAFKSNAADVTYEYRDVPPEVAAALAEAPSVGSFVHRVIKPGFEFDRLPNVEAADSEGGETA